MKKSISNTPPVTFVLDNLLLEQASQQRLPDFLRAKGFGAHVTEYVPLHRDVPDLPLSDDECVVLYGSIGFVEQHMKGRGFVPGAYYTKGRFDCSRYLPNIPLDLIGNSQGIYVPFGEFVRRREQMYRLFGASRLFIRPDSGAKVFTGLAINEEEIDFEINSLKQLTSVTDSTMVMVAPAQEISHEYRFFIVEGKVVTGSRYKRDGELNVSIAVNQACWNVAEQIAALPWQIDLAYACDVGIFNGVPKLVELNAFSTSGLYACDAERLFCAVANAAQREFAGEISITG